MLILSMRKDILTTMCILTTSKEVRKKTRLSSILSQPINVVVVIVVVVTVSVDIVVIVVVVIIVGSSNLILKFCQNWVSNSWNIVIVVIFTVVDVYADPQVQL